MCTWVSAFAGSGCHQVKLASDNVFARDIGDVGVGGDGVGGGVVVVADAVRAPAVAVDAAAELVVGAAAAVGAHK